MKKLKNEKIEKEKSKIKYLDFIPPPQPSKPLVVRSATYFLVLCGIAGTIDMVVS